MSTRTQYVQFALADTSQLEELSQEAVDRMLENTETVITFDAWFQESNSERTTISSTAMQT